MTIAPTIVFDLDGTLVDTAPDLMATLNVILAQEGCEPVELADARAMIGMGAKVMLQQGLQARFKAVSAAHLEELYHRFLDHYAANIAVHSRPFPGAVEAMDALAEQGCRLAVCTNKLEGLARRLLDDLGLSERFAAIVGGDTFPFAKPDPRMLLATIARAEGEPTLSVMVGDSATDADTAKAAEVPCVLVDFGYTPVPARDLGANRVISHFDELVGAVAALIEAQRVAA